MNIKDGAKKTCKYYCPSTYAVCAWCKRDGRYADCWGNEKKCKYNTLNKRSKK